MIKLPISDFEMGIGVFQNHKLVIYSPIGDFEKHQPQFKITYWSFYHQLVNLIFSSLVIAPSEHGFRNEGTVGI